MGSRKVLQEISSVSKVPRRKVNHEEKGTKIACCGLLRRGKAKIQGGETTRDFGGEEKDSMGFWERAGEGQLIDRRCDKGRPQGQGGGVKRLQGQEKGGGTGMTWGGGWDSGLRF